MKQKDLLAFLVWAIDCDMLNMPIEKSWEKYEATAKRIYDVYTDPDDEYLYLPTLVGMSTLEVMADYTLFYAKMFANSGESYYGELTEQILQS